MKLSELVLSANTGADAIKRAPIVTEDTGLRCLRIGDVSQKRPYSEWGFTRTTEDDYKRYRLEVDDIIIARTGNTIGVNCIISEDRESVYNNGLIRIKANTNLVYPKYLWYIISGKGCQDYIQSIAFATSTQPNMKINDFLRYSFDCQEMSVQKKIIEVIDPIDKKIAVNEEISEILLRQAHQIYLDFLQSNDFTEVSFVDGCFGKPIKPGIKHFEGRKIYIATADVNKLMITNKSTEVTYENRPSRANMQPREWSAWFAKMKDSRKLIFIDNNADALCKNYVFSTGFYGLDIKPEYFYYIWAFMSSDEFDGMKNLYCNGTTMQAINNDGVKRITLKKPDSEALIVFNNKIAPIYNAIRAIAEENEQLSALRNYLLPQLLAGKLEV